MKTNFFALMLLVAVGVGILLPNTTLALSCMDPQGMIEYYVSSDDYTIFKATAGEVYEYVKEPAQEDGMDPNFQFDSGYTGQFVTVSEAYKGYPEAEQYVYFEKNSTWGYLCAGAPPKVGTEALYIVNQNGGMFSLVQVVNVYEADSQLAKDIVAALAENTDEDYQPTVQPIDITDIKNRIITDIKEMYFILSVKFAEFKLWAAR